MADNYPQEPKINVEEPESKDIRLDPIGVFPTDKERQRLEQYEYYEKLFLGDHFEAFSIKIDDPTFNKAYSKLRYIAVNFAGLLSKIMADMLFSEPIKVKLPDGDQEYIDAWWRLNKMDSQLYESALGTSSLGDGVFKLRIDKLNDTDTSSIVIAEDTNPRVFFPDVNPFNAREKTKKVEFKWLFEMDGKKYLRVETHEPRKISNKIYEMRDNKIIGEAPLSMIDGLEPEQATDIDELMVFHVPNWKMSNRYFGLSDYRDLTTLFYGLNNRISAIDNILDKHSDPILMVPRGVIDPKTGKVNKRAIGVIEVDSDSEGKPEYIIWDASLDSAFKEVEKIIEMLYQISEISPDLLGMGQGMSDSGRALKFKLMRTLAKASRKKLYYDQVIKDMVYMVQVLSKKHGLKIDGKELRGEPVRPEIDWADGLPIDLHEQLLDEISAVDAGLTSKKDAITRLYQIDEKSAEEVLQTVDDEAPAITMPTSTPFNPKNTKPKQNTGNKGTI